jgi:uncharacterized protein (DUF1499 family)
MPSRYAVSRRCPAAGLLIAIGLGALPGGCGGAPAPSLGVQNGRLTECPDSPNCVSSDSADGDHRVDAFKLAATGAADWRAVQVVVAGMPRAKITLANADYLRAEFSSAVLGFVDDLELQWRPASATLAVRSASRVGYSDLGVNRRRVAQLGELLRQHGIVR